MKIIIVRHGETVENDAGIIQGHLPGKLSVKGIAQAKKLGRHFERKEIDYIYSSDLARSIDTAKEIFKYHPGIPVKYWDMIRERHLGEFQGKTRKDIGWNRDDHKTSFLQPKKGETVEMLFDRAQKVLEFIINTHPRDTVLLVTHGGLAKAMISIMENLGIKGYSSLPSLENTSVSIYDYNEKSGYQRVEFNSVTHLD